jgi:hypothetical protein
MTGEQKRKRGRPAVAADVARKNRIIFMADDATKSWLEWHSMEAGLSVSEIIRRAVTAYRALNA